jgi:hypothetical protein
MNDFLRARLPVMADARINRTTVYPLPPCISLLFHCLYPALAIANNDIRFTMLRISPVNTDSPRLSGMA